MTSVPVETTRGAKTTWKIDAAHTTVELAVRHMMIATVNGHFTAVRGTVTTTGDDPTTAVVDVTIPAASINTRNEQRDAHLRSADFLDAENHPNITFRSTGVERAGGDKLRLDGDLTIRGTTLPLTLDVTIEGRGKDPWGGERSAFSATTKINRQEFGLRWNQALETGGVLVADEVRISVDVELVKETG